MKKFYTIGCDKNGKNNDKSDKNGKKIYKFDKI